MNTHVNTLRIHCLLGCICRLHCTRYISLHVYFIPQFWLSNLEILAILLAAAIHDVDHPGTTNTFQIKTLSVCARSALDVYIYMYMGTCMYVIYYM